MGFTTGFTGGLTLTLGVAYLTVLAHQRNRERQAEILRANAAVLNTLAAAPGAQPVALPPSRSEIAAIQRANFVDAAKDRWNAEIEGAVRWAQEKDWAQVREQVEEGAGRLWARTVGGDVAERVKTEAVVAGREAKHAAEAEGAGVAAAARSALERTKAQARTESAQVASSASTKASEVKAAASSALQRGVEKGKEVAANVKAAVGLAEEKSVNKAKAATLGLSEVELALQQRYAPPTTMDQSVEAALNERYKPAEKRDTTLLKGI